MKLKPVLVRFCKPNTSSVNKRIMYVRLKIIQTVKLLDLPTPADQELQHHWRLLHAHDHWSTLFLVDHL